MKRVKDRKNTFYILSNPMRYYGSKSALSLYSKCTSLELVPRLKIVTRHYILHIPVNLYIRNVLIVMPLVISEKFIITCYNRIIYLHLNIYVSNQIFGNHRRETSYKDLNEFSAIIVTKEN